MDYSAEVRRRFAAALAASESRGDSEFRVVSGEAEDRSLAVWAKAVLGISNGRIAAAAFEVYGCPDTIAAAHLAAERLRGVEVSRISGIDAQGLARELGIPREKLGKLLRLEDAAIAAAEQAR
jgi:NifU-like protein involved in Fe-S cluster formation